MPGHILDANTIALWPLDETAPAYTTIAAFRASAEANGNYNLLSQSASNAPFIQGGPMLALGLGSDHCRYFGYPTTSSTNNRSLRANGDASATAALLDAEWTIEAWVYLDRTVTEVGATIFLFEYRGTGETEAANGLAAFTVTTGEILNIGWERGAGINEGLASGSALPLRQWVHIAATAVENGSNRDTLLYINGVEVASGSIPKATGGSSSHWFFGRNQDNNNITSVGIAYARVSTVARTLTEIQAAAANPAAITNDDDTFALWPLQDAPDHRDISRTGIHLCSNNLRAGSNPPTQIFGISGPVFPLLTSRARQFTSSSSDFLVGPTRRAFHDAFLGANEYTVETWVNTRGNTSTVELLRTNGGGETQQTNFLFRFQLVSGVTHDLFFETGGGVNQNFAATLSDFNNAGIADGWQWHHIAWRKRSVGGGQSQWDIFVDGTLRETSSSLPDPEASGYQNEFTQELALGLQVSQFCNMRVSNVARTEEEILESYTRGIGEAAEDEGESGALPLQYFMRARNPTNTAYVFWASITADFAGSSAPGGITPGSAVVVAVRRDTRLYQLAAAEANAVQLIDSPDTVQTTPIGVVAVALVDTSAGGWSDADVVLLPATPLVQTKVVVKDIGSAASTKTIVVGGNGNTIDDQASMVLSVDYASVSFVYTGSEWKVI